ncbi:hypothetical protein V8G54_023376 [Vigna mungo]|uniref:Uncharacterized protein n=1 Tax=Vigna mungo TaxID=3915 RepID=A0AAQ3N4M4_VIGMU
MARRPSSLSFSTASTPLFSSLAVNTIMNPFEANCLHIANPIPFKGRGRTVIHNVISSNVSNDGWPRRRRGAKEQQHFSLRELASGVELSEDMASETLGMEEGSEIFHRQRPPLALYSSGHALAGEVEAALAAVAYDVVIEKWERGKQCKERNWIVEVCSVCVLQASVFPATEVVALFYFGPAYNRSL